MKRLALVVLVAVAGCNEPDPAPAPSKSSVEHAYEAAKTFPEVPVSTASKQAREAFEKGRDLQLNTREGEAIEQFKQALAADAGFAFAHAWLGYLTPGAEGAAELDKAMAGREKLPEPERLSIEGLAALRGGDRVKATTLARKIVDLAPFDWRAQLDLGNRLYDERSFDEATQHYAKAAAFGPNTAPVYNVLGYGYLMQHKFDAAATAFRKYADLKPDEPNALDSLGEALMAAGKFPEAEQAFAKAAAANFSFAWDGVALTRFFRGDWDGGLEANAKSHEEALRSVDKLDADAVAVWALLAKGDLAEANKRIDALEKDAQAEKADEAYATALVYRALALADGGKEQDAVKELGRAVERGEKAKLPGIAMNRLKRLALSFRAVLEAKAGGDAAEKTAAALEADAKKAPGDLDLQSLASLGRGAAALAKGDAKAAVQALANCVDQDYVCRWELLVAAEKVPDPTGAGLARDKLLAMNARDAAYLYVRSKAAAGAGEKHGD